MECKACCLDKPEDEFPVRNDRSGRRRPYCKECTANVNRARYQHHRRTEPFKLRCTRAKARAAYLNVPFNLTPEYLEEIWTGRCPVTGAPLHWHTDRKDESAAELDRLVPALGYVKGNVAFISRRINRLKNDATLQELERLVEWLKYQSD